MNTVTVFDFETYMAEDGSVPKAVVCAVKRGNEPSALYLPADVLPLLWDAMQNGDTLVAHHAPFDLAVLLETAVALLTPKEALRYRSAVWKHLNDGLVSCSRVRSLLISIADGSMQGVRPIAHSLDAVVMRLLGQDISAGKKGPDSWRTRYAELDGVSLAEYPAEARDYPLWTWT